MVALNELASFEGSRKTRTRVGRGIGSGKGKTCGRGVKGQKSRSGVAIKGFEGGQMPIFRRLPKRGFNNYNRKNIESVNIGMLQQFFDAGKIAKGETVDTAKLVALNVISGKKDGVKILSKGELKAAITIEANAFSKGAEEAIKKAGGKATIVEFKAAPKAEEAK